MVVVDGNLEFGAGGVKRGWGRERGERDKVSNLNLSWAIR